eukprot:1715155-Alexandrium_andersonii.AAC.1
MSGAQPSGVVAMTATSTPRHSVPSLGQRRHMYSQSKHFDSVDPTDDGGQSPGSLPRLPRTRL